MATISSGSATLVKYPSAPLSRPCSLSSRWTKVVEMCSTGIAHVAGSDLMRRQTSNPSMSGNLTSRMTRSGREPTSRSASLPVAASWTSKPARISVFASVYRLAASSSTSRMKFSRVLSHYYGPAALAKAGGRRPALLNESRT